MYQPIGRGVLHSVSKKRVWLFQKLLLLSGKDFYFNKILRVEFKQKSITGGPQPSLDLSNNTTSSRFSCHVTVPLMYVNIFSKRALVIRRVRFFFTSTVKYKRNFCLSVVSWSTEKFKYTLVFHRAEIYTETFHYLINRDVFNPRHF